MLEKEKIPFRLLEHFDRKQVLKAVNEYEPDIVHAHDFSASVICAAVTGEHRLISHLHYDPPWVRRWNIKTVAYALCRKRIDRVLVVSRGMFDGMVFAATYQNITDAVGNPIDAFKIRKRAMETLTQGACMDGKAGFEKEYASDILFAGRFVEQKNPQRFIRLIGRLKESGWESVKAIMIGEGLLRPECEKLIDDMELKDNIRMKGFQENPYPYISATRLLCITSRWEGFGLVAAEANILGTPVVTTDTAGGIEIFGETAPEICHTDEEFISKIERLHNDTEEYDLWCLRSGRKAENLDNVGEYMAFMADIYEREAAL